MVQYDSAQQKSWNQPRWHCSSLDGAVQTQRRLGTGGRQGKEKSTPAYSLPHAVTHTSCAISDKKPEVLSSRAQIRCPKLWWYCTMLSLEWPLCLPGYAGDDQWGFQPLKMPLLPNLHHKHGNQPKNSAAASAHSLRFVPTVDLV